MLISLHYIVVYRIYQYYSVYPCSLGVGLKCPDNEFPSNITSEFCCCALMVTVGETMKSNLQSNMYLPGISLVGNADGLMVCTTRTHTLTHIHMHALTRTHTHTHTHTTNTQATHAHRHATRGTQEFQHRIYLVCCVKNTRF